MCPIPSSKLMSKLYNLIASNSLPLGTAGQVRSVSYTSIVELGWSAESLKLTNIGP